MADFNYLIQLKISQSLLLSVTSTHEGGFSGGEWTSLVIKFVSKAENNEKYMYFYCF